MNEEVLSRFVGRFARMRELAAQAERDSPNDPQALFGACRGYLMSGDYASAFFVASKCCALEPSNTHYQFERGVIAEYLGRTSDAEVSYRAALVAEPLNYKARYALVHLRKQTEGDNIAADLERWFDGIDIDGWRTLHIGHALAKSYEDFGDLERAMQWLGRAKGVRRRLRPYDPAREQALADAITSAPALGARAGYPSHEPIFVAGLPRSGTTLVDRILSSHPDVTSAGEIGNFLWIHTLITGAATALSADALGGNREFDSVKLGRSYIESTRPLTGNTPRFVDKAPSNYLLAERILAALPNARVICMRRKPLESVLSNYKQIFPIDDRFFDYVYALEAAAHKVVQFERVITAWRERLPSDRFMVLQYEDLVSQQEERTRGLLKFCDLSWDERCLSFHENNKGVATPSALQVRSAMHSRAVARVRSYGTLLDPARRVLEQAGVELE